MLKSFLHTLGICLLILTLYSNTAYCKGVTKAYTNEYPPISIRKGRKSSGLGSDILKEMNKRSKTRTSIIFGSWSSVYKKTLQNKTAAIFPIVRTAEREDKFTWVGPICSSDYFIYKSPSKNISLLSKDAIASATSIATFKNYALNPTFIELGCKNLKYFDTPKQAIIAVILGRCDICIFPKYIIDTFHKESRIANLPKVSDDPGILGSIMDNDSGVTLSYGTDIESYDDVTSRKKEMSQLEISKSNKHVEIVPIFPFLTEDFYIALNKDLPKRVAIRMQNDLLEIEKDGTLIKLFKKYQIPSKNMPHILSQPIFPNKKIVKNTPTEPAQHQNNAIKVYAEYFPPFTFSVEGSKYVQGGVAELIYSIQEVLGNKPAKITLSDWNNVFNIVRTTPNTAVCTLKRIPERENDFYWIGPYAADSAWLYARRDFAQKVTSIEEAKKLAVIACVDQSFANAVLTNAGFTNLVAYDTPDEVVFDIMTNPEHVAAFSRVIAPYVVRNAGHAAINVKPLLEVSKKTNYYIGISKLTPKAVAVEWQKTFNKIKSSGKLAFILNRWIK